MNIDYMTESRLDRIDSARRSYADAHEAGWPEVKRVALYRQTKAQVEYDRAMRVKHRARELRKTFEERRKPRNVLLDMMYGFVIAKRPWAVVRSTGI